MLGGKNGRKPGSRLFIAAKGAKKINKMPKTLRLVLGDQLNINHTWFKTVNDEVTYVLMEIRSETDYVVHHIQKVIGFFSGMRLFAEALSTKGHQVLYLKINDNINLQAIDLNCRELIRQYGFEKFEYQLPDEYRMDLLLTAFCENIDIPSQAFDTEHFYTSRGELGLLFKGKSSYLMETFYRYMRKKHDILMEGSNPLHGRWNFDAENRKKLPRDFKSTPPLLFANNVNEVYADIKVAGITTIGNVNPDEYLWPINRKQSLILLNHFAKVCLPLFGTYQDAMAPGEWSLFHSRLSFSLNTKMISPREVIARVIEEYHKRPEEIEYHQLEGFVRQIIGWREYMRGIYWLKMPEYGTLNTLEHTNELPEWYWNGQTNMKCLSDCIRQSLDYGYAHHIQRLMVTGNFALLAGTHPDEVDKWYLGIYVDALDWVEITNTRGMSQFADGGIVATKPYVSSAAYVDKMSHYCATCYYDKSKKTGEKACPFNSFYWHFLSRHEEQFKTNARMSMMYNVWYKYDDAQRQEILNQAEHYLQNIHQL